MNKITCRQAILTVMKINKRYLMSNEDIRKSIKKEFNFTFQHNTIAKNLSFLKSENIVYSMKSIKGHWSEYGLVKSLTLTREDIREMERKDEFYIM